MMRKLSYALVASALWLTIPATTSAQSALKPSATVSAAQTVAPQNTSGKPLWSELTREQQQALKPLAATWGTISEAQKRKWLVVSKNYASLSVDGQTTMHSRMNEWVNLSPLQRAQARLNFATTKELSNQLTPEEKLAKWQIYQSLSSDEKQKLADKALVKPTGAALAIKPVPPQKLAPVQPSSSALPPRTARPAKALPASAPGLTPPSASTLGGDLANTSGANP